MPSKWSNGRVHMAQGRIKAHMTAMQETIKDITWVWRQRHSAGTVLSQGRCFLVFPFSREFFSFIFLFLPSSTRTHSVFPPRALYSRSFFIPSALIVDQGDEMRGFVRYWRLGTRRNGRVERMHFASLRSI